MRGIHRGGNIYEDLLHASVRSADSFPAVTFPARQTGDELAQTYVDMLNELAK